jgi:hypothetical protein
VICQRCGQREASQAAKGFTIRGSGESASVDEKSRELCDECNTAFKAWLDEARDFVNQQVRSGVPLHEAAVQAKERFPHRTLAEFLGLTS